MKIGKYHCTAAAMVSRSFFAAFFAFAAGGAAAQPDLTPAYPVLVSEYAERTGPGTMAFLGYPKYYRNDSGALLPVRTDLAVSDEAGWDYEASEGIWSLRVRATGTFQASHRGDVFAYRLAGLGYGLGDAFEPLDLGEPDFGRHEVADNVIRWRGVFPGVDLTVKYLHDILKVDVILSDAFMEDLRAAAAEGLVAPDAYLTARFDIPLARIASEPKLRGEPRDLYAEPVDVDGGLTFEADGAAVHKLLPVEVRPAGADGADGEWAAVPTRQTWRLSRDAAGAAEIAARVDGLAGLPPGPVSIDPSMLWGGESVADSLLDNGSGIDYGGYSSVTWNPNDHLLFAFSDIHAPTSAFVSSATLSFQAYSVSLDSPVDARACRVTQTWSESSVDWYRRGGSSLWSAAGGSHDANDYYGRNTPLPTSGSKRIFIDVTQPYKKLLISDSLYLSGMGFLVKMVGLPSGFVGVRMREYGTVSQRPRLDVAYSSSAFGIHPIAPNALSPAMPEYIGQMQRVGQDRFSIARFLYESSHNVWKEHLPGFCDQARANGLKVFIHVPVGSNQKPEYVTTKTAFKNFVMELLNYGEQQGGYISEGPIAGIEIGGEEENKSMWFPDGFDPGVDIYFGNEAMGRNFAEYYVEAAKAIRQAYPTLEIIGGGAVEKHTSMDFRLDDSRGNAGNFIRGFIDETIDTALADDKGKYDYLPDTVSIHSYMGKFPPENFDDGTVREWFDRLGSLHNICGEFGYIPNYANTEYGWSVCPSCDNGWAPYGMTARMQSIYYLRSCLINATVKPHNAIGWKFHSRFAHNRGVYGGNVDFGFHNNDTQDNGYGSHRAIKYLSRGLFDPAAALEKRIMLQHPDTLVWHSAERIKPNGDDPGVAWCGWETPHAKWGAIWRYLDLDTIYVSDDDVNMDFTVPEKYSGLTVDKLYRFSVTSSGAVLNEATGTVTKQTIGSYTRFSIPHVSENPILIRFN